MLRPLLLKVGAVLCGVLAASSVLAADALVLRQRITAGFDSPPREQLQYFAPRLRVTDDERARSIVDLDAERVTFINKVKQTVLVMTFAEMGARRDRHDDRVAELPANLQQTIRAREKVTAKPTGRTGNIAGYPAKEYEVSSNKVSGSVWITPDLQLPGKASDWQRLLVLMGGTSSPGGQLDETLAKIGGVALRRNLRLDPLPQTTTEVLEIRREPIPGELLEIPDGYAKVDPPPTRTATIQRKTPTPKAATPPSKR